MSSAQQENIMFATNVQANNHGSAAGPSVTAAPAPSVTVTEKVAGNRSALESLGNNGMGYTTAPMTNNYGRPRRTAMSADSRYSAGSALGEETREARSRSRESSDDTLVFSPNLVAPAARSASPRKREVRARPGSAKQMALATSPPGNRVRKAWSSSGGAFRPASAEAPPRDRAPLRADRPPQSMEERQAQEKALNEHTRMGFDLRRELFTKFGAVEAAIEGKVANLEGQMQEMRVYVAAAEARLPIDGAVLKQGFTKLEGEIDILKRQALEAFIPGSTLTPPMLEELERMRQRTVAHEQAIGALSGSAAHLQLLLDSLGALRAAHCPAAVLHRGYPRGPRGTPVRHHSASSGR